ELLHQREKKFEFHQPVRLEKPPPELICGHTCEERNFADLRCGDCNKNFCKACDKQVHKNQKGKRNHNRVPLSQPASGTNCVANHEEVDAEEEEEEEEESD